MADFRIYAGETSQTVYIRLRDSTTGLGKTALVFDSAGATCSYTLPGAARAAITLATLASASAAWSSGGFILVDDTNCKGLYRLDLPNAAIASGKYTVISIEFDGIIEESMVIPLEIPDVNLLQILGTTLTETAGLLAGGFKKFFNVSSPTGTLNSIPDAVAGAAGGVFVAGTNAATTVTTSFTTTFTGSLTGNVDGSVASVTADVGITAAAVDLIWDESMVETTGAPAITGSMRLFMSWWAGLSRNKVTQTATTTTLRNDADAADLSTSTVSDDTTTFTRGEFST